MSGKASSITVADLSLELDAAERARTYCIARWGAARGHMDWRVTHDAFIEGYKTANCAQQARIDELETQLFITQAEPALPLFEVMHLEPVPPFPSITYTTERTT